MKRKLLIHPGFHKTGTTSAQAFLGENWAQLLPYVTVYRQRPNGVLHSCLGGARAYSRYGDELSRLKFQTRFVGVLEMIQKAQTPNVIITAEGLSGHILGYKGREDFAATYDLVTDICTCFDQLLADEWELMISYTTRQRDTWLESVYKHLTASTNFYEDWEPFRDRLYDQADLNQVVAKIAKIAGADRVASYPLEDTTNHPLGPASALLDWLDLPSDVINSLSEPEIRNTALPDARLAQIREINMRDLDSAARAAEIAKLAPEG